ncbi:MAG TPA: cation-translocating P-type ATPase [Verrucomicrobiae bacterium]|jgi:Cu+-exporting ATPase|nr:cation-translocating P-type ATPase [Verrucomicrobiae bacterium]
MAAITTELQVNGMTCGNCARHVTEAIQSVPGVHSATVNLDSHSASVRWAPGGKHDVTAIVQAIEKEGYSAKVRAAQDHDHGEHELAGWQVNLVIAVLGTAPLMIGEWAFNLGMMRWFHWFSFVLASIVQIFAGTQFYRGAWNQLKIGSSNMDTLVALGSTTAFAYSVWALFSGFGGHLYFMEAASIITLISVGHWVESRVSVRASDALRQLLNLAPQTARRIVIARSSRREEAPIFDQSLLTSAATEEEVPVAELQIDNLVALRPGDRVPTDGKVVEGHSTVDEAMLTGESAPVDKSPNGDLFAGTVNLNGRLVMRVTATGEETALSHIIAAVQRAQTSRANIQRLGDRVSNVFVPIIVSIALAAALWWGFAPESAARLHAWLGQFLWHTHLPNLPLAAPFIIAAAVLIIACPCAMGLATPAAIMAGSNAAARRGILVRDGVALEKAGQITAVIFDKTGTLTFGKPEVAAMGTPNSDSARFDSIPIAREPAVSAPTTERGALLREIYTLAAALARHSTHPISQAIAKLYDENIGERAAVAGKEAAANWKEIRGAGVEADSDSPDSTISRKARLGSLRWLRESSVDISKGENFIAEWSAQGATIVGLASDAKLLALFAVRDAVKPGSAKVVEQLGRQGFEIYMVTGDNALTAAGIAKQTGIKQENVFAEIRPEQKAEFVKKLQQQAKRVAFVGDGINDAPALEQADLGVAVSRASDVAREAADIILLKSDIEAVPEALGLARATLRTIKQNLFWAFFYNAIGVPLAALGFMSPILCAAAMGFSDLIVIGNALRLRAWRPRDRG